MGRWRRGYTRSPSGRSLPGCSLTLTSGVQVAAGDKSLVDSLEGTVVWEYDAMACPQTIVKLFRGMRKA